MEFPGKYLKAQRELRNLSLEEIAKSTKIRERFLRAIEEDQYELLPSAVYVKGFLTLYARHLGLDSHDIGLRYQNYLKSLTISQPAELEQQIPPPKKRARPWPFFVAISAIIFFIVLVIYYTSRSPLEQFPPPFKQQPTSAPSPLTGQGKTEPQTVHQPMLKEISRPGELKTEETIKPEVSSFEILEANMGTAIERESGRLVLSGKSSEFTCNNQRAYFFTRIRAQREGKIAHVWFWEGKEFVKIEIDVKPPVWSVYSYITLRPQYVGIWKAEIRDGDNILKSLSFKVIKVDSYSIQEETKGIDKVVWADRM
jgi:transcriptional regulator with XRE-family HTH domain